MKPTGYINDLKDTRDRFFRASSAFAESITTPPETCTELFDSLDVRLEQSAQSCVGFSIAYGLYACWLNSGIRNPALPSPRFIWYNSRKTHGAESSDSGTYIRSAIKQMAKLGICTESKVPSLNGFDEREFAIRPSTLAYHEAYDQRLSSLEYYRIDAYSSEALRVQWMVALSKKYPVVFGIPVNEDFMEYRGSGYIVPTARSFIGGHAMCALGYDTHGVFGYNSWGSSWGDRGAFRLSWEYIEQYALDQWALRVSQYFS